LQLYIVAKYDNAMTFIKMITKVIAAASRDRRSGSEVPNRNSWNSIADGREQTARNGADERGNIQIAL